MGQNKSSDISQIDKKCFRDMTWLKQNVTKRVILRLTMTHFDPIGAHLSISLNNFKLLSSKIMATTNVNQYDQTLNDENLLLQIGKNLELLTAQSTSEIGSKGEPSKNPFKNKKNCGN